MKKIYSLILLTSLFALGSYASELTVADGTETNASLPICGYFADYLFQGQMLYPSIEVAAMAKGEISSLTFYSSTAAQTYGSGTISVKLAEVSESAMTASPLAPEFTEVYKGAYSIESGKLVITFTTKFTYSGTKNLLLDISCANKGTAPSEDNWFYGQTFSAAGYSNYVKKGTFTYSADVENFLPKTTFTYSAGAATCTQPVSVGTSVVEAKSATLQWTKADGGDQVQYALVEEGKDAVWSDPTSDASKEFSDLKPLTNYSFYVRTYCSASEQSAPIKTTFTTEKSCFAPKDLKVENITHNSATLSWNAGKEELNYEYIVVPAGETPVWGESGKDHGSRLVELKGLKMATSYDVYVRSDCGAGEYSESEKVSFKTICGAITDLPWEETFKGLAADAMPECWEKGEGTDNIYVTSIGSHTNNCLAFKFDAAGAQTAILPEFGIRLDTLAISFWYKTLNDESAYNATLQLGYLNASNEFTKIATYEKVKDYVYVKNVKLEGIPQETKRLAFRYTTDALSYMYIDDITIHVPEIETGLESIQNSECKIQKVIENGQIYLIHEGQKYTIFGTRVD